MKRRFSIILLIAAIAISLTACSPGGAMYHEILTYGLEDGQYVAYQGYGSSRTMALLTISGSNVSLTLHSRDPFTEEWIEEPFAMYSGTFTHTDSFSVPSTYDWDVTYLIARFRFNEETGSGRYDRYDLSGYASVIYGLTYQDIPRYDSFAEIHPYTGMSIQLTDPGYTYEEPSMLTAFGTWTRL